MQKIMIVCPATQKHSILSEALDFTPKSCFELKNMYFLITNLIFTGMKKWTLLMSLCVLMTECAAFGSKTLYRAENAPAIRNIGYCDLYGKDTLTSIFPQTCEIFYSTMDECAEKYGLPMLVRIEPMVSENADSIAVICEKYGLDAFLFTELKSMKVTYTAFFMALI